MFACLRFCVFAVLRVCVFACLRVLYFLSLCLDLGCVVMNIFMNLSTDFGGGGGRVGDGCVRSFLYIDNPSYVSPLYLFNRSIKNH